MPRALHIAWMVSGAVSFAFIALSIYVSGKGAPWRRWLLDATGQDSWPVAISAAAFIAFEYSVGGAIVVAVIRFVLRRILLLNADQGVGVLESLRQTGTMVNQRPVMALRVRIDTPNEPVIATIRKLVDLGNMPRPGDRVRLRVSRIDPTCASYQGLI